MSPSAYVRICFSSLLVLKRVEIAVIVSLFSHYAEWSCNLLRISADLSELWFKWKRQGMQLCTYSRETLALPTAAVISWPAETEMIIQASWTKHTYISTWLHCCWCMRAVGKSTFTRMFLFSFLRDEYLIKDQFVCFDRKSANDLCMLY